MRSSNRIMKVVSKTLGRGTVDGLQDPLVDLLPEVVGVGQVQPDRAHVALQPLEADRPVVPAQVGEERRRQVARAAATDVGLRTQAHGGGAVPGAPRAHPVGQHGRRARRAVDAVEAVAQYDETKGVPFGAFLATQLSKWVHDLGRNAHGRTAADTEHKQQKAIAAFIAENQRRPSEKELAAYMGQSVATLRRNSQTVATLNGLRNLQSLDGGPDATEILLPDSSEAPDEIMGEAEQTLLSHALTAACAPDPDARRDQRAGQPNVLGWATWYLTTWGGQTKTQLSSDLNTSVRNMNVYADRVEQALKVRLSELVD